MIKSRPKVTFESPLQTRKRARTYKKKKQPTAGTPAAPVSVTLPADAPVIIEHFDPTRPACMKPTSNRKATGAQNPNPYNRAYLVKSLSLTSANWDLVHSALVDTFEKNPDLMDLQRQQVALCARLNAIGLPEDVVRLLPVELETCKFLMYHVALLARRKVAAQSAIKQIAVLRKVMTVIQSEAKENNTTVNDLKTLTTVHTAEIDTLKTELKGAVADIGVLKRELKGAVAENNEEMLGKFERMLAKHVGAKSG